MRFFYEGGIVMWPILLVGLTALALGGIALGTRSRGVAVGALLTSGVVLLLAVFGMLHGRSQTERALVGAQLAPREAELIREQGFKESNRPLQLGGPFVALGLLLGAVGLKRGS